MPKRQIVQPHYAYINPEILSWAINRSGRTREAIAEAIDVTVETIASWERRDGDYPLFAQAVDLANYLSIPFGYLFLSEPPIRKLPITDNRTLADSVPLSQNFQRLLSDVLVRRDWYRQYVVERGAKPFSFVGSVGLSADPQAVASDIRHVLKLSTTD